MPSALGPTDPGEHYVGGLLRCDRLLKEKSVQEILGSLIKDDQSNKFSNRLKLINGTVTYHPDFLEDVTDKELNQLCADILLLVSKNL